MAGAHAAMAGFVGYAPLGASLDTTTADGSTGVPGTAVTNSVTCTASGGSGSYTYAWTYVSGSAQTVNSPAAATTTWQQFYAAPGGMGGVYKCVVTDTVTGLTVDSANVTVTTDGS